MSKSPFDIKQQLKHKDFDPTVASTEWEDEKTQEIEATAIAEILTILGEKGCSIYLASKVLDKAKIIMQTSTALHNEYK